MKKIFLTILVFYVFLPCLFAQRGGDAFGDIDSTAKFRRITDNPDKTVSVTVLKDRHGERNIIKTTIKKQNNNKNIVYKSIAKNTTTGKKKYTFVKVTYNKKMPANFRDIAFKLEWNTAPTFFPTKFIYEFGEGKLRSRSGNNIVQSIGFFTPTLSSGKFLLFPRSRSMSINGSANKVTAKTEIISNKKVITQAEFDALAANPRKWQSLVKPGKNSKIFVRETFTDGTTLDSIGFQITGLGELVAIKTLGLNPAGAFTLDYLNVLFGFEVEFVATEFAGKRLDAVMVPADLALWGFKK